MGSSNYILLCKVLLVLRVVLLLAVSFLHYIFYILHSTSLLLVLVVEILQVLIVYILLVGILLHSSSSSVCTICHLPTLSVQCSHHTQPNQHLPTLTNIFSTRTEELASRVFICQRGKNVDVKISASCTFLEFCRSTVKSASIFHMQN